VPHRSRAAPDRASVPRPASWARPRSCRRFHGMDGLTLLGFVLHALARYTDGCTARGSAWVILAAVARASSPITLPSPRNVARLGDRLLRIRPLVNAADGLAQYGSKRTANRSATAGMALPHDALAGGARSDPRRLRPGPARRGPLRGRGPGTEE
jgi:hypothetical protein